MAIMTNMESCGLDEYGEEIMYAGWNPDVALLVYRQQCSEAKRLMERPCVEQMYLPREAYPPFE